MHVSGKVFAGLVVVAFLAAIYFTTKAFSIRDAWMKLAQDNEAAIRKNAEEIAVKTRIRNEKRAEYARTMIGWDREWLSPAARLEANGNIGLQIGTNQGVMPDQLLFVFAPNPDGTSVYVGDFKVERTNEQGTQAKLNSRRRPSDFKEVQFQSVRVRTMLPNPYVNRLGVLDQDLLAEELKIRNNQAELARQGRLDKQADNLIAARIRELNGNPDLVGQAIPAVFIEGLLTAIVREEEAHHASLIEADRLARDLKKTRDEFNRIRKDNLQRVEALRNAAGNQAASR
jgi:hypothetical protein